MPLPYSPITWMLGKCTPTFQKIAIVSEAIGLAAF
jgi:hypothetical protein